jgi:hypothetical protein
VSKCGIVASDIFLFGVFPFWPFVGPLSRLISQTTVKPVPHAVQSSNFFHEIERIKRLEGNWKLTFTLTSSKKKLENAHSINQPCWDPRRCAPAGKPAMTVLTWPFRWILVRDAFMPVGWTHFFRFHNKRKLVQLEVIQTSEFMQSDVTSVCLHLITLKRCALLSRKVY